jgi:uncharacterized protein YcfJ
MKRTLLAAVLLLPLATMAQHRESYAPTMAPPTTSVIQDTTEYARVLDYKPIPGPSLARQVCSPVAVAPSSDHNPAGAILGGLTGALVGSRFGGGGGKDAATIAGAIGGAMVGDRMGSGNASAQQQCTVVYEPGPPAGYQVTYDYKGKLLQTTTSSPPGEYLRVRNRITVE